MVINKDEVNFTLEANFYRVKYLKSIRGGTVSWRIIKAYAQSHQLEIHEFVNFQGTH